MMGDATVAGMVICGTLWTIPGSPMEMSRYRTCTSICNCTVHVLIIFAGSLLCNLTMYFDRQGLHKYGTGTATAGVPVLHCQIVLVLVP